MIPLCDVFHKCLHFLDPALNNGLEWFAYDVTLVGGKQAYSGDRVDYIVSHIIGGQAN